MAVFYPDEAPVRGRDVAPFELDVAPATNPAVQRFRGKDGLRHRGRADPRPGGLGIPAVPEYAGLCAGMQRQ